ncbi:MAG TPA: hypothetical protein VGJ22_10080 [Anaerolineales bacterium]
MPHRDSGVYLYIGQGVLQGGLPYRDFWDHKGPLIYYLNAAGLLLVPVSYWGVWLVEVVMLCLAALTSLAVIKRLRNVFAAWAGTIVWLFGFRYVMDGGNRVEEYALLLYFLQMALFLLPDRRLAGWRRFFLIGVLAGFGGLLRPNLISPFVSIALILLWNLIVSKPAARELVKSTHLHELIALISGAGLTFAAAFLFFAVQGAGRDFYRDVFAYNFLYAQTGTQHWEALLTALRLLWLPAVIAFAGWLPAGRDLLAAKESVFPKPLLQYALIALPVEMSLSLVSGFKNSHYFIPWLPVLGLLAAMAVYRTSTVLTSLGERGATRAAQGVLYSMPLVLVIALCLQNLPALSVAASDPGRSGRLFSVDYDRSSEWIQAKRLLDSVAPGTAVFFWGNEVKYNFVMGRPAPSRYIYLYPFLMPGFPTDSMGREFLADLEEKKPVIVDIRPAAIPALGSQNAWRDYPTLLPAVRYIHENYEIVDNFAVGTVVYVENIKYVLEREWIVWKYKP